MCLINLTLVFLREEGINQPLVSWATTSTTTRHL